MSADNGIYILKLKGQSRVISAQAIENLWWSFVEFCTCGKVVPSRVVEYFKDAKPMTHRQAQMSAFEMEKQFPILEYGIRTIIINKTWNQLVNEAKEYAKLEIEQIKKKVNEPFNPKKDWLLQVIPRLEEILSVELTSDEVHVCIDCGNDYVLEGGEIDFYKLHNLHLPKRCKTCRAKKVKKTS